MAGNQLAFPVVAIDEATKTFERIAKSVAKLNDRLDKLDGQNAEVKVSEKTVQNVEKTSTFASGLATNLGKVSKTAASMGAGVAKISLLGGAMASSAASSVQLAAAIAPAAGALAALPAAAAVGAAGLATLKVALAGTGEAFGAALTGSTEDFTRSLEGLSPAAQETAQALRDLKPGFDELRSSVQDNFFARLPDTITEVGEALLGPLSEGMTQVAGDMGELADNLLRVAATDDAVSLVGDTFDALSDVINKIRPGLRLLAEAFVDLGGVGVEAFSGLGDGLGGLITDFANWLQAAVDSGKALDWITNAVEVFKQLGAIIAPVFTIIAQIGSAASATGGDLLGTLGLLTGALADFLSSAEGQDFLLGLFEGLNSIGEALGPVIVALGTALAPLLPIVGQIAAALGPGLAALATGLGAGLAAIAPALVPIAEALSAIVAAAAPVLGIIGEIIGSIASALGPVLAAVGEGVAKIFTAAQPAIEALLPAIETFAGILSEIGTEVFVQLADILATLLPQLLELAGVMIDQMLPVWEDMGGKIMDLLPVLGELIISLAEALLPILSTLLPVWMELQATIGTALLDALVAIIPLITMLVEVLTPIIEILAIVLAAILTLITKGLEVLLDWIVDLIQWWSDLASNVYDATAGIREDVGDIVDWVKEKFDEWKDKLEDVIQWFKDLPGNITDAVGDLRELLIDAGEDIINGLIDGIKNIVGDLKETLSWVTGLVPDWKGPMAVDKRLLTPSGEAIMTGLMAGIAGQVPALRAQLRSVTGIIADTTAMDTAIRAGIEPLTSPAALSGAMPLAGQSGGDVVVNVTAYNDRFNLGQVLGELAMRAVV